MTIVDPAALFQVSSAYRSPLETEILLIGLVHQVTYTILLLPISIARFSSYAGANIPAGFTFTADVIFALGGQFSPILVIATQVDVA